MTPGLSVLIPVFNWDVKALVDALLAQQADWPGPVEIIVLDDGSCEDIRLVNRQVAAGTNVRYEELKGNIGRSAIRNYLTRLAQYEWLLLLDNDSLLPDAQFVARYAAACHRASVLIGGTTYTATAPSDAALHLRWLYGHAREARPAAVRQQAPHAQLTINNALIRANILSRFPLDEHLTGYGHEDTVFGLALAAHNIDVLHLDNPVLHGGLEPAATFLAKSEQAVSNLAKVIRQSGEAHDSRLAATAFALRKWQLHNLAHTALAALEPRLCRNLLSPKPSLRALDLLKLRWLLKHL